MAAASRRPSREGMDPTERLLARLSRVRPDPVLEEDDLRDVDFDRLTALAARIANFNLIAARLVETPLAVPREVRRRLARNLAWAELRERLGLKDVAALAAELAGHGEPLLLLKGAAFTRFIYPRLGLRSFVDLDVLVRPEAVPQALRVLRSLRYETVHAIEGSTDLVRRLDDAAPGGEPRHLAGMSLAIELHTRLVHHHEYPYYREELALDERRLMGRAEERTLDSSRVLVMRASDELLYAVLHFFYHHDLRGLKYHSDLNALLTDTRRELDFDDAIRAAEEARGQVAVGLALLVHERLFGAGSVPGPLLARLAPRGVRRWALARALPPLGRLPVVEGRVAAHPAKVLAAPGLRGPLGLALRRLVPGKRYLMDLYGLEPARWSPGYHLRYLASMLRRGLRRSLPGSREA